jgi:hypothetical protein
MAHHFPISHLQMLWTTVFSHVNAKVLKVFYHLDQCFVCVAFKIFEIHKNAQFFCLNYLVKLKNLLFLCSYPLANTPYRTKNGFSSTRPRRDCQHARSRSSKCVCASNPCKNCSRSQVATVFLLYHPLSGKCQLRAYSRPLTCTFRTASTHD